MKKLKNYILDSIDEIRNKVSWVKIQRIAKQCYFGAGGISDFRPGHWFSRFWL